MAIVTESFTSAPRGKRVVYPLIISVAAAILGLGLSMFFAWQRHGYPIPFPFYPVDAQGAFRHSDALARSKHQQSPWVNGSILIAPILAALIGIPKYFRELRMTAQFKIQENRLFYGKKSQPLEGLVEAVRDPEVMKGACKRWGNGGLGAIRGSFRSKRLGKFEAFLTDTEHAVVLRWPDKVLAVSPSDPEFFIYSARKAAGLA